jgi:hypothetical protein
MRYGMLLFLGCAGHPRPVPTELAPSIAPDVEEVALSKIVSLPDASGPVHTEPTKDMPFDRGAAAAALVKAHERAAACGAFELHARVTFMPDGSATFVMIDAFDGCPHVDPLAACVKGAFASARVPPFHGDPVTVGKSITSPTKKRPIFDRE